MAEIPVFALVGGDSLLGREVRDLAGALPADLRLIASEEQEAGALTEQAGEAAFLGALDFETLSGARVVFLAGSRESARQALELASDAAFIDLTHAAEDRSNARLRAPMVEPQGYSADRGSVQVVAHPAAVALALVLGRLHAAHAVRRAVVHVFEPASERGARGLDELHQQTVNLFAFRGLPKEVFDQQLSFNMLARYGETAPVALEEAEARIERHLATLLSLSPSAVPMPSLRLIQAPVFHGYSFSLWVEFERNPGAAAVEQALEGDYVEVRRAAAEPPTGVGHAGQSGVALGAIAVDHNQPQACWLWMVADNLRLLGENAVAVARQLL